VIVFCSSTIALTCCLCRTYLLADFGQHSVVLGVLLVLLARVLGTGVFLMHIDTAGRRTLLLAGTSIVLLVLLMDAG
jgi:hypothetical protein